MLFPKQPSRNCQQLDRLLVSVTRLSRLGCLLHNVVMISPVPTAPQQEFTRTDANVYKAVQEYYGKDLCTANDLKTSACTAGGRPAARIREVLSKIPQEVLEKFYGCGTPLPLGIEGLRVLDLGSGSGRDCFICAALVGERGLVTGIDMTEEQIQARSHTPSYTSSAVCWHVSTLHQHGVAQATHAIAAYCQLHSAHACPAPPAA